jgi:hypothetical protein
VFCVEQSADTYVLTQKHINSVSNMITFSRVPNPGFMLLSCTPFTHVHCVFITVHIFQNATLKPTQELTQTKL